MTNETTSFFLVCFGTFASFLAIGIPLPVIPDFTHGTLGFDMVTTGLAIGLQSFATVVTRRLAGARTDAGGPRPTTRTGYLVCVVAGLFYLLAEVIGQSAPGLSLGAFLVGRVTLGLGESLLLTGALTWGIALIGPKYSGRVMSWNGIAMYGALALGAPIGLWLNERFGFRGITLAVIAVPWVSLLVTRRVPTGTVSRAASTEVAFLKTVRAIWAEGCGLALATVGFGAISAFIAVYFRAHGWPFAGVGLLLFGGCYILVRLLFGDLPDRIGGRRVAAVSLVFEVVGQLTLYFADRPAVALVGVALTALGFSLIFPSFGVQALKRVSPERRGTALGAFSAFFDVALGTTGPLCGAIIALADVSSVYLFGAGAALASLGLIWVSSGGERLKSARA